ncbi:MAG: pilus assembly protein PilZ [Methylomonas sp.]|nr:MAG: pilus assembly protein PilZ [Methylobacter sp.]PPD32465.1 MAG: pilus assembly protein PilZ [Methylomonas sp.]
MNSMIDRAYRKNLSTQGVVFLAGQERPVTVRNLSITGVLIELNNITRAGEHDSSQDLYELALDALKVDIFLPDMRIAGEADVVRVDMENDKVLLALEFNNISHDVDNLLYKRKVYRKNMSVPGSILLGGQYLDFDTVNVSVDGIMIELKETVRVEPGLVTVFEFHELDLQGEARIIWVDVLATGQMLMGMQYVHMEKTVIPDVPQFERIDVSPA